MTARSVSAGLALWLWSVSIAVAQEAPAADHHQHLFSAGLATLLSASPPARVTPPLGAADLVAQLDAAGIRRAVVLSTAYIWSQPSRKVDSDYEHVKADNDWTSQQVALYPDRLIGFCGLNPLRDYALAELARCARDAHLRRGLKIHIGNSGVDYLNAQHVERVRQVFRAANGYGMAIVVHMRASFTEKRSYGRAEAAVFLNDVGSAAPDVPIQIAHLAGAGSDDDPAALEALAVFAEAIARDDPRVARLWFDVAAITSAKPSAVAAEQVASQIRQLGLSRILYGSDAAIPGNSPKEAWATFRQLPLTVDELTAIARNVPPYLRDR